MENFFEYAIVFLFGFTVGVVFIVIIFEYFNNKNDIEMAIKSNLSIKQYYDYKYGPRKTGGS